MTVMSLKRFLTVSAAFVCVAASAFLFHACSSAGEDSFQSIERGRICMRDSILNLITGAEISANEVIITKFGAEGDGVTDCRPAFDEAMKYAAENGGAHIIVPEGTWFVGGPIHFESNVCLDIQENAVLLFSPDPSLYLPVVYTSWEATFLYNYSPYIYGYGLHDVAITGKGTINGNSTDTFATWLGRQWDDQMLTRKMNHEEVPVEERVFGEGYLLRPQLIQFFNCRNITVEGIHMTDCPFWCVHLLECENAICRGLSYDAERVNNDGIDPECSRNVLIEDIDFDNGDDDVAIKSGRDNDGRNVGIPSENIIIRNCRFNGHSGVALGSEMSGGIRNVFIEDCTFGGFCRIGVYLKTNPDRGGYIRDVYVNNCEFDEVGRLFEVTTGYANEGRDNNHYAKIENIYVDGLRCRKARDYGLLLQGIGENPISNVIFRNVEIAEADNPMRVENVTKIEMKDCRIGDN